jgi:hypothetical protein
VHKGGGRVVDVVVGCSLLWLQVLTITNEVLTLFVISWLGDTMENPRVLKHLGEEKVHNTGLV